MFAMNLIAAWPRLMSPDVAKEYVGGDMILRALLAQKLLTPRVQRKGLTRYDKADLDAACDAFRSLDET